MLGVKPVMVGVPAAGATVKGVLLVADPAAAATPMGPVVASGGTIATSSVVVDVRTDADFPSNVTVLSVAASPKPVPEIVTTVPAGPVFGVNSMIETRAEL